MQPGPGEAAAETDRRPAMRYWYGFHCRLVCGGGQARYGWLVGWLAGWLVGRVGHEFDVVPSMVIHGFGFDVEGGC